MKIYNYTLHVLECQAITVFFSLFYREYIERLEEMGGFKTDFLEILDVLELVLERLTTHPEFKKDHFHWSEELQKYELVPFRK